MPSLYGQWESDRENEGDAALFFPAHPGDWECHPAGKLRREHSPKPALCPLNFSASVGGPEVPTNHKLMAYPSNFPSIY